MDLDIFLLYDKYRKNFSDWYYKRISMSDPAWVVTQPAIVSSFSNLGLLVETQSFELLGDKLTLVTAHR